MKKLMILMAAACCLTFTACNNNKPAEQPAEGTEMQAEEPCCKEMTEEQKTAYARCWQDYTNLQDMFRTVDRWVQDHYDPSVSLTDEETAQRTAYYKALDELEAKLRESGDALNKLFDEPIRLRWNYSTAYWYEKDSDINEVYVDFR